MGHVALSTFAHASLLPGINTLTLNLTNTYCFQDAAHESPLCEAFFDSPSILATPSFALPLDIILNVLVAVLKNEKKQVN